MIKLEDRLTIRNKVLESLRSSLPWLGNQVRSLRIPSRGRNQTEKMVNNPEEDIKLVINSEPNEIAYRLPTLQEVLGAEETREPYTILLGLCDDGLPLTLNLTNPAPGSVLITADQGAGKTRLLHSILDSVALINSSDQVSFNIITTDVNEYTDLAEWPNCQKLVAFDSPSAMTLLQELYDTSEKRRSEPAQLVLILVIEELASFIRKTSANQFSQLMRLIKHGPRLGIWVFASLSASAIEQIDPAVLDAFRTHLLGFIDDSELANYLARTDDCPSSQLTEGTQFCAFVDGDWFSFWICDNGGGEL